MVRREKLKYFCLLYFDYGHMDSTEITPNPCRNLQLAQVTKALETQHHLPLCRCLCPQCYVPKPLLLLRFLIASTKECKSLQFKNLSIKGRTCAEGFLWLSHGVPQFLLVHSVTLMPKRLRHFCTLFEVLSLQTTFFTKHVENLSQKNGQRHIFRRNNTQHY